MEDDEPRQIQFVLFQIGSRACAAPIHQIQEVLAFGNITPLPQAPPYLEGVTDLRGTLIPVIDLKKRMGVEAERGTGQQRILVIRINRKVVGAIVDSVEQVITVSAEEIQAPPESATIHGIDYVLAFVKQKNQICMVLDLDRILNGAEILPALQV